MSQIRPALVDDALSISRVAGALGYAESSHQEAAARVQAILEAPDHHLFVWEEAGTVCGWIHCFEAIRAASPPFLEIGGLVVDPDWRRRGIARALVLKAVECAHERRLKVRVRCRAEREEAHLFYTAIGFDKKKSQHVFEMGLWSTG